MRRVELGDESEKTVPHRFAPTLLLLKADDPLFFRTSGDLADTREIRL